ncbi:MAG: helix-turn-helix domain-containing protein [Ignavibacteria bacterium]|nr:helix-turn-helix domain-containing protein [Ignavibacteria bacterium]
MLKDFGNDLKKLREAKGISLAEISAETRINIKFLNFLEEGVFDFQPETYIRSFIKAYARAIGENENQMVNDYDKAKAGFYTRRKFTENSENEKDKAKTYGIKSESVQGNIEEQIPLSEKVRPVSYEKSEYERDSFPAGKWLQKVLIALLGVALSAGIYFLWNYLSGSATQKSEVKPKTFDEITESYEDKIKGKKDTLLAADSLKQVVGDSLQLMVKALKDIRVKVYIDEKSLIEEELKAKDSLLIKAKEQFRFSASSGENVHIYLNGTFLRKPLSASSGSIKNLIINKDGIVQ